MACVREGGKGVSGDPGRAWLTWTKRWAWRGCDSGGGEQRLAGGRGRPLRWADVCGGGAGGVPVETRCVAAARGLTWRSPQRRREREQQEKTNEKSLIGFLAHRDAAQRRQIRLAYKEGLIKCLKFELSGEFVSVILRQEAVLLVEAADGGSFGGGLCEMVEYWGFTYPQHPTQFSGRADVITLQQKLGLPSDVKNTRKVQVLAG